MASVTLSVDEKFKDQLKRFLWVNWSEIAREGAMKKIIFENYIKTGNLNNEEWEYCEKIDWHPVDELPLKEEFKRRIESARREKSIRFKSIEELRKIIEK